MGSCGGNDEKIDPPTPPTFKEQLVSEGPWRVVSLEGEKLETVLQGIEDELSQDQGFNFKGTENQNSLRFDTSGKITWKWEVTFSLPDVLDVRILFTIKGPYFVTEDSGSSATMTLSFAEADVQAWIDDEAFDIGNLGDNLFGDLADDERASINGDQLRIGDSLFERKN